MPCYRAFLGACLFLTATLHLLEQQLPAADSESTWLAAQDGMWTDADNWDTDFFPNRNNGGLATHAAIINAVGSPYTVFLQEFVNLESVTIASADATLALSSTLTSLGDIDIQAGHVRTNTSTTANSLSLAANSSVHVENGGILISNGWSNAGNVLLDDGSNLTIRADLASNALGSINNSAGGTISFQGVMDNTGRSFTIDSQIGNWNWLGSVHGGDILIADNSPTPLIRRLELNDTTYHGDVIVDDGSIVSFSSLTLNSGSTFTGNATLTPDSSITVHDTQTWANKNVAMQDASILVRDNHTLTLGAGTVVEGHGGLVASDGRIVNQGTIRGTSPFSGNEMSISGDFVNEGLIEATNQGLMKVSFGESAENEGTLRVDGDSTLRIEGSLTLPRLGNVEHQEGGTLEFIGSLNLEGTTLAYPDTESPWTFGRAGCCVGTQSYISNGEVAAGMLGNKLLAQKLTASNVTFHGDVLLDSHFDSPLSRSELTLVGQSTITGDRVKIVGFQANLTAHGQTFEGKTFELDEGGTLTIGASTLGSDTVITGGGRVFGVDGSPIENHGVISSSPGPGGIYISHVSNFGIMENVSLGTFVNQPNGIIRATANNQVQISTAEWQNSGQIFIEENATLAIDTRFNRANLGNYDNSAGGRVEIRTFFENEGQLLSLDANDGHWHLNSGTIQGGEIEVLEGASLTYRNAVFDGTTFLGDLVIEAGNLALREGATFTGNAEFTSGGISLADDTTFVGKSIRLETGNIGYTASSLYLDATTTVSGSGTLWGKSLENHGTVLSDAGDRLQIRGPNFSSSQVDNYGTFSATGGSTIRVGLTGGRESWRNFGVIRADSTSSIDLGGRFELTDVGVLEIQAGTKINVIGTFDLGGASLEADDIAPWTLRNGEVINGALRPSTNGTLWRFGRGDEIFPLNRLENVTVHHDILLAETSATLSLGPGSTFEGDAHLTAEATWLQFDDDITLTDQEISMVEFSVVEVKSGRLLTLGPNAVVRGAGDLIGPIHNEGTIRADIPAARLSVLGIHNAGHLEVLAGSEMHARNITGYQPIIARGKLGILGGIEPRLIFLGGELSTGFSSVSALFLDDDSRVDIAGHITTISDQLVFEMLDESTWSIDDSTWLQFDGGHDATFEDRTTWARLEVGGADLGNNPSGFSNNFEIPNLVLQDGTQLLLTDYFDNGNRGTSGREVLYVDELRFLGDNATLNLNGIDIFYNTLIGNPDQIVNIPVNGGGLTPDLDDDGIIDTDDIDALIAAISSGDHNSAFDLNGDGPVDETDLIQWLAEAGALNLPGGVSYDFADANLDGRVDGLDFLAWNANKFTTSSAWTQGDFNADGIVNGLDFVVWNTNKNFVAQAVPETQFNLLAIMLATLVILKTHPTAERR